MCVVKEGEKERWRKKRSGIKKRKVAYTYLLVNPRANKGVC